MVAWTRAIAMGLNSGFRIYSRALKNTGLNCASPLIYGFLKNKHTIGSPYSQVFRLQIQPTVDRQLYFQPIVGDSTDMKS